MVTQQKLTRQVLAPKTWDKPTTHAQIGDVINSPFMAVMQVADRELLEDGRVRLLVKPLTGTFAEEWIIEPEPVTRPSEPKCAQPENTPVEPVSSLDSPSCALQPAWLALQEYDRGVWWGKHDASAQSQPMYTEASCPHSTGYLDAYNSFTIANQKSQPPETKKPIQWKVVYAPDWDWKWYKAMVGDKCIGKYCSCEEAQAAAQKYIAAEQARREHRELVMAAYAG